jgi:hypothetical protein
MLTIPNPLTQVNFILILIYVDLVNSTWRSSPVVSSLIGSQPKIGLSSFAKIWPGYISNDNEMDLYLY